MITLLSKIFIKDKDYSSETARKGYGMLCGAVGIFLNIVLFLIKFIAGTISSSIAVTADAFNNLSDAGSSIVTLVGFRMAGQKPDHEHPFGHGRFEYISGLIVAFLIILMGFELGRSSVAKIISPEPTHFSILTCCILVISIAVKAYMAFYNRAIGKKVDSTAMRVVSADSLNDCIATAVVLACTLVDSFFHIEIDGWCGVAVAIFILVSGVKAAKETISPLLGEPAPKEFVSAVADTVLAHDQIRGIHDLIVHSYGPGRRMISLHAEVSVNSDLLQIHDTVDNIERELQQKLGCIAVIHIDPVSDEDESTVALRGKVADIVEGLDKRLTMHDFRVVAGPTHTNVIFDVVVPYDFSLSDEQLKNRLQVCVSGIDPSYYTVVNIDRPYN